MKTTVFLGGGRITRALVAGLHLARYHARLVVHDRHPRKLQALQQYRGLSTDSDLHHALGEADLGIIAVQPNSVAQLLEQVGPMGRPLRLVSLAAGVPINRLRTYLGGPVHWARAMPSPLASTRRGLTALTFEKNFPPAGRQAIKALFAQVGVVVEIPEARFDAFTVIFSPSHGYHALAALAEAGLNLGLDRKLALTAAAHALGDAVFSWRAGKASLTRRLEEAATPGGVAAATMGAMNSAGYSRVVGKGVRAGLARARKNAKL